MSPCGVIEVDPGTKQPVAGGSEHNHTGLGGPGKGIECGGQLTDGHRIKCVDRRTIQGHDSNPIADFSVHMLHWRAGDISVHEGLSPVDQRVSAVPSINVAWLESVPPLACANANRALAT